MESSTDAINALALPEQVKARLRRMRQQVFDDAMRYAIIQAAQEVCAQMPGQDPDTETASVIDHIDAVQQAQLEAGRQARAGIPKKVTGPAQVRKGRDPLIADIIYKQG